MTERFELLEQIGKGGMGTVWKARDTETGEVVALKLLHDMYVDDADYVARFEREVDIARKIDSPHVVKVLGYGKRNGVPYVAMEYVGGPSLKELIRENGPQGWEDWGQAKRIALQLTEALRAAHAVGVIHRDIKPSNVLIDPQGNVKLADFGIARAADLTRMTGGYTMLGTPAYMSPEGESSVQSDLYGLGCVLYEMLAGGPPFAGDTQQQVLLKHIREAPNLAKLPEGARRIVAWLLQKDPKKRPTTAEALIGVLEGSTGNSRPRAAIPGETGAGGGRGGSNGRKVALFGGVPLVVLLAGAGMAFALAGGSDPTEPTDADATPPPADTSLSVAIATPSPTSDSSATPVPPSLTPVPPTATPEPPTATPAPPTATPVPPTATPVPPTATPTPTPTATLPPTATATATLPSLAIQLSPLTAGACDSGNATLVMTSFPMGPTGSTWRSRVLGPNGIGRSAPFPAEVFVRLQTAPSVWSLCGPPHGERYCFAFSTIGPNGMQVDSPEYCTEAGR